MTTSLHVVNAQENIKKEMQKYVFLCKEFLTVTKKIQCQCVWCRKWLQTWKINISELAQSEPRAFKPWDVRMAEVKQLCNEKWSSSLQVTEVLVKSNPSQFIHNSKWFVYPFLPLYVLVSKSRRGEGLDFNILSVFSHWIGEPALWEQKLQWISGSHFCWWFQPQGSVGFNIMSHPRGLSAHLPLLVSILFFQMADNQQSHEMQLMELMMWCTLVTGVFVYFHHEILSLFFSLSLNPSPLHICPHNITLLCMVQIEAVEEVLHACRH